MQIHALQAGESRSSLPLFAVTDIYRARVLDAVNIRKKSGSSIFAPPINT
jgi:hypothetical protein